MLTKHIDNKRGAAYMLALVTLLVGCVLALAMLRAGNAYFMAEDSRAKKQADANLASAGIEYAYHQVHYNGSPLPFNATVNLGGGTFTVQAVDDGSRDPSTMLITSTGVSGGNSGVTIKRVTVGLLPYHYAWCQNSRISSGVQVTSTAGTRGIRCNSDVILTSFNTNISTGIWSTGLCLAFGYSSPSYSYNVPIAFPEINFASYRSAAGSVYNSNVLITSLQSSQPALIWINGNATINLTTATYRGSITIVCTGNITVQSNLIKQNNNSYLALITEKTINLESAASNVSATLYAHKSNNSGSIQVNGFTVFTGSMAADSISINSPVTLQRDSRLNLDVMRQLRLPGL
ncbi:MAG: hypothetical protein GX139_12855 [Armatimonadetes bacterium]|jgi:hypothetical protein|nr:hypothetical protein [Armatimonadota bacterium]